MKPKVAILQQSEAFADIWEWLCKEVEDDVEVQLLRNGTPLREFALVVLSAGAAEREALDWLERNDLAQHVPVIVAGIDYSRRTAMEAVRSGAADYFSLPDDLSLLRNAVAAIAYTHRHHDDAKDDLGGDPDQFMEIVGHSDHATRIRAKIAWLARYSDVPVLVTGSGGTGKESVARAIHTHSPRRGPFVTVDCTNLTGDNLADEVFGRAAGADTPTHAAKPGLLDVSEGGTAMLDEIGRASTDFQDELLALLRRSRVRALGVGPLQRTSVRIIATTSHDLESGVTDGTVRRELLDELGIITVHLPDLVERRDDLPALATTILKSVAAEYQLPVSPLSGEALDRLQTHDWPGNVRELRNVLVRAALLSPPGQLVTREVEMAIKTKADRQGALTSAEGPR